jgi:uncharacterized protein (TIGR02145 family)
MNSYARNPDRLNLFTPEIYPKKYDRLLILTTMKKSAFLLIGLSFLMIKNHAQIVTDYDGNVYDTVIIGTQVWLKQNLKVAHYNNGVAIPNITDNTSWNSSNTGARCYYNNDSVTYDSIYGPLYNWYAVNDINNICPPGWHVATNAEWQETEAYLGGAGIAGGKMKEAGFLHWTSPNTGATNSTGFTGLPGGMRDPVNNDFRTIGENGLWWTATSYNSSMVWSTYMWYLFAGIDHNPVTKKYGLSIRCVKDINTGVGEINNPDKFRLYPNPATDRITIDFTENNDLSLWIYNILGEIVLQKALTPRTNEIDISLLPKGFYTIKASCASLKVVQKLIKE